MFTQGQDHGQADDDLIEDPSAPNGTDETSTTEAPDDEAPQYLTQAQLDTALAAHTQKVERLVQSRTDRTEGRMRQRFQQLAGPYQQAANVAVGAGIIKPEQKAAFIKALRDDAINSAFAADTDTPRPGQPRQAAPDDEGEPPPDTATDDITAQGEQLATELGLVAGDPELRYVVTNQTPDEFLASIRVAARIKAARLSQGQPRQQPGPQGQRLPRPPATGAPPPRAPAPRGRSPAVGGNSGRVADNNPIANIESATDLYDLAWKEARGG